MTDAHGKVLNPAEAVDHIADGVAPAASGFVNISQNVKSVAFLDTFASIRLDMEIDDGLLHVVKDGRQAKFVEPMQHPTFSGRAACTSGQRLCYITERALFELTDNRPVSNRDRTGCRSAA